MRKIANNQLRVRIDKGLKHLINGYLTTNPQLSISDFVRDAIRDYLTRDIQDRELTALNVQQLIKKSENLKNMQLLTMELLSFFIKSWMAYLTDVPKGLKDAAWKAAEVRFGRFMKAFKVSLKNNTNLIQKLIMGYLEGGGTVKN